MLDIILCVVLAGIVLAGIRIAAWKIGDSIGQRKQNPSHDPADIKPFIPFEDIPDGVDYCFNPECGNVVPEGRMYCPVCEELFKTNPDKPAPFSPNYDTLMTENARRAYEARRKALVAKALMESGTEAIEAASQAGYGSVKSMRQAIKKYCPEVDK